MAPLPETAQRTGIPAACGQSPSLHQPISCGGQTVVGTGKFLRLKRRNFGDNVVNERLQRRRRAPASDIVHPARQGVTTAGLAATFGNREAGGFRRQRRERETRGFISITSDGVFRVPANWTLEPPVSTPISHPVPPAGVTHDLVFFIGWRVCAGATVIGPQYGCPLRPSFR